MRFRQLMIALFALSMIPILWLEADAQDVCKTWRNIAGSRTCVRWVPGSEDCTLTSTGGALTNSTARCEVDPSPFSETNSLTGTLVCMPAPSSEFSLTAAAKQKKEKEREKKKNECKDHEFNGKGKGHDHHDDDCVVTPNVTIDGNDVDFPLFTQTGDGAVQCDRRGNCKTRLSVNIPQEDGNEICERVNNPDNVGESGPTFLFVNFTANQFLGTARICDGGNFVEGEGGVDCNSEGPQLFLETLCTLSEDGRRYLCEEVSD